MQPQALAKQEEQVIAQPVEMRRFTYADVHKHGAWVVPRMLKAYPELSEQTAVGWLKLFVVSNEYLFLFQPNGAALFQLMPGYTLVPTQIVQERFVWAEDPKNELQTLQAADFYTEAYQWSMRLNGIETLIVDENSDVPRSVIEDTMVKGHKVRILKRELTFVRVKER